MPSGGGAVPLLLLLLLLLLRASLVLLQPWRWLPAACLASCGSILMSNLLFCCPGRCTCSSCAAKD